MYDTLAINIAKEFICPQYQYTKILNISTLVELFDKGYLNCSFNKKDFITLDHSVRSLCVVHAYYEIDGLRKINISRSVLFYLITFSIWFWNKRNINISRLSDYPQCYLICTTILDKHHNQDILLVFNCQKTTVSDLFNTSPGCCFNKAFRR